MTGMTILSKLELYSAIQTMKKDSTRINEMIKWRLTGAEPDDAVKHKITAALTQSIDEIKFISPIYEKIELNSFYPYSIKAYGEFREYYVMLTIQHHETTPEIYNYEIILFDHFQACRNTFDEYF